VFADELRVEPLESPEDVAGLYHIEQTFDIFQDYALTVSESSDWRFSAGDTEMKLMGQLSTSLVDDNDLAEWMLVYGNVEESKKFPTESGRFVSAEAILWCDRLIEEPALADARFNELINAHYQVYRYQEESRHPRTLLKDLTDSQKERIQTIYREGLLKSEKMDDCALSWDDNRQEFGDLVRTDFLYRYSEDWHVVYLHKHVIKYEEIFNFFEGIQEFEYGSGKIVFAVGRQMDRRFYPDTSFGLDPVAFEELLQRSLSFGEPSRSLSNTVFQIENHFDEVIELRVHADWFDVSSHYSELSADSAYNFNNAASIDYLRPYYWKKLALYSSRDDAWEYVDDAWESGEGQLFDDVQLTLSAVRVLQVQESEDLPRLTEQQFIDHFRPFIADAARSLYQ
jgi:hypothetical protein